MEVNFETICQKVCQVARNAGHYIAHERKSFSAHSIEYKGSQNLVSYVDKEAQRLILGELAQILSGAQILAEESDSSDSIVEITSGGVSGDGFLWVVDPLDGTTNFTHSFPPYCVSIALLRGSEVVVGVVYEITQDECFYAWQGSACYLNGVVVSVSDIGEVSKSLVVTGIAYNMDEGEARFSRAFSYFNTHSNGTRRIGSAAADLAYVAAGRAECFFQWNLSPWDVAAGSLLVERAGGKIIDYDGGDNYIFGRSLIATNFNSHKQFKDILCENLF